ncbi:hypothetical protein QE60_000998, partial [Salmonella enterica subsp. enterica]|nr:hypothetical protein [Salmonella enterica subsp. enterica]
PANLAGGINLYQYASNPLSWIDPLGLCPKTAQKGEHATLRHRQGRPVGQTISDIQRARKADVLIQSDGRWVVLGPNGRAHVIEADGSEIITSMSGVSRSNVGRRRGRDDQSWRDVSWEEFDNFQDIFKDHRGNKR